MLGVGAQLSRICCFRVSSDSCGQCVSQGYSLSSQDPAREGSAAESTWSLVEFKFLWPVELRASGSGWLSAGGCPWFPAKRAFCFIKSYKGEFLGKRDTTVLWNGMEWNGMTMTSHRLWCIPLEANHSFCPHSVWGPEGGIMGDHFRPQGRRQGNMKLGLQSSEKRILRKTGLGMKCMSHESQIDNQ